MRILHVIPQFPYFGGRTIIGGHASCLLTLALAQAAAGDEVTILSYVEKQAGDIPVEDGLVVHSMSANARPGTVGHGLAILRDAAAWTKARRDAFDVIHGHSGFADYLTVSARLKRLTGLPTLHTMYCPIPEAGGRWHWPIVHGVLRRAASAIDTCLAMSENVATSMRAFGIRDVEIVPPPVDIERFHTGASPERQTLGLADDEVAYLFVGNAKPQKNMSAVLRAFRQVLDHHGRSRLIVTTELAQSSSDENLRALDREMRDLDLTDHVIQLGIIPNMPELMQACDVLVAPFLDSFGPSDYFMACLEAMACGKPVVVSAVGGMPEVIDDSRGALVDPHDVDAIANAMLAYAQDAASCRAAGERARQYTETHFDPSSVAARYRALYHAPANSTAAGGVPAAQERT